DNFISMNTVHNDLICARINNLDAILDNFLTFEENHINTIQGSLDNLLSVRKNYLAATYDDTIGFEEEYLATVENDITNVDNNMA
ncbi:28291_t:CDS:1, partial [Racocetra persica]